MSITMVAAVASNGVIGRDGGMPWHLPEDMRRFRRLTHGHPLVMGRRTFESIGRPLPGRTTVVVTRDGRWSHPGALTAPSLEQALEIAAELPGGDDIMVVGGGEIYRRAMPLADRLEITEVGREVVGDTTFPAIDPAVWSAAATEVAGDLRYVRYLRRPDGGAELARLLARLEPRRRPGSFVFCTVAGPVPAGLSPAATVAEAEGTTLVLESGAAAAAGLDGSDELAWIELGVESSLTAVGLTSVVARTLADDGIPANVLAGYHHDHILVPVARADRALARLRDRQQQGSEPRDRGSALA